MDESLALIRRHIAAGTLLDERGKLLPIAGEFAGLNIKDARAKVVEKLGAKGCLFPAPLCDTGLSCR